MVAIANYEGAEGRTVTVQVASWKDGVLGTKTGVLGEATGDMPSGTASRISVTVEDDQVSIAVID